ncbi:hypothetical protein NDU88_002151 [Pleurodeles waltl]|uniref:Uncharacterized protein n=1 Tax=Pleurodeles waltl TaxID=8319 RepID=A0AAV7U8V2_PLEWA|nr:hypothetical protein NDU88_002151 [Pleurodeles waltl]
MEVLFTSLHDDIQAVKKDLSADLWEVRWNLEETGDAVSAMVDLKAGSEGEVEWLHQEVLCLRDQHIELQAHAEDPYLSLTLTPKYLLGS